MIRANTPDPTNATSGLTPKISNGRVQPRCFRTSISQRQVASPRQASPAVKTTYELVQMFLLIGNTQPHTAPIVVASTPAANSPAKRSRRGRGEAIERPTSTPSIAVTIAGIVDR